MPENELSSLIRAHRLTVTQCGTSTNERWVAYNHDYAARGDTPEEAVKEAVRRLGGPTAGAA